ncbi:hypothetical protein APHAL10511_007175 [Amanita phalloides]|nr:hypothetical protein APHAL10511_007175 [Amanita phalloides]
MKQSQRIIAFLTLLPVLLAAQTTCEYSCPEKDQKEWGLLSEPTAIGPDSVYSIFECVYTNTENVHTCTYYKDIGEQAEGYAGNACPPQAVRCVDVDIPRFSGQEEYQAPPWVSDGRWMRHLMAHPIPDGAS